MNMLTELFSSRVRAEIVRLLFGLSATPLHLREIQRKAGLAVGTIQRDIAKMVKMGLVVRRADRNRVLFTANMAHPLTPDLRRIVLKTSGLVDGLRQAIGTIGIRYAFVFGSIVTGNEKPESDVDLMILGDVSLREISHRLAGLGDQIGREINPHVMTVAEYVRRRDTKDHFISSLKALPRIWIAGTEDDLETMG